MPTYDYVCDACGHALEIFQSISEAPKKKCPACGRSKLARRIGAGAGFLFKGEGFYKTDYRSDSYKAGQKAESSAQTPADAKDSSPKPAASESTSKPEPKPPAKGSSKSEKS